MYHKKKIKAIVCGVGFGQFYIEGLKLINDEIELVGILSTGSERSRICAEHYGIDIYTNIDEIKEDIDLACVVVKSEIMGGQGTDLAINLLSRGINVILEHPVNHKNIAKCIKTARKNNVFFTIGDLYTRLPSVKQYLACAKKVLEKQKLEYIEIECSTRVLFPMVHIISELLPSISRIQIESVTKELGIYQIMLGTIGKVPFIFKANNEVNVNQPDGYIREFHKISINVPGGKLTLTDTHGPILWQPILTLPTLKNDPRHMFDKYKEHLLEDSTMIIGQSKSPSYKEILSKYWPRAIADNILEMRDMIIRKTKKSYNVDLQKIIIVSEKWQYLSNELGYPQLNSNKIDDKIDSYMFENTIEEYTNDQLDEHSVVEYINSLEQASLGSMLYTMQSQGVLAPNMRYDEKDIISGLDIAPKNISVIKKWLKELTDKNYIKFIDNKYICNKDIITYKDMEDSWNQLRASSNRKICSRLVVDYFRTNAINLYKLMNDQLNPTFLLFPEGCMDYANALYSETIIAKYLNKNISNKVLELCREKKEKLIILEVGAGTGSTSKVVLEDIANTFQDRVDYLFTDISKFFISRAKSNLKRYSNITYNTLNIDEDITKQGINTESIDIIIANGVLNNAGNMKYTLSNFDKILRNKGYLLVIEPTKEFVEMLISQAFMMTSPNDDRNNTETTFLNATQWIDIFQQNGFIIENILPDENNILKHFGQNLFIVKKEVKGGCNGKNHSIKY